MMMLDGQKKNCSKKCFAAVLLLCWAFGLKANSLLFFSLAFGIIVNL